MLLQDEQGSSRPLLFLMHPATYLYSPCCLLGQAQQPSMGQGGSPGRRRLRSALWSGSHLFLEAGPWLHGGRLF